MSNTTLAKETRAKIAQAKNLDNGETKNKAIQKFFNKLIQDNSQKEFNGEYTKNQIHYGYLFFLLFEKYNKQRKELLAEGKSLTDNLKLDPALFGLIKEPMPKTQDINIIFMLQMAILEEEKKLGLESLINEIIISDYGSGKNKKILDANQEKNTVKSFLIANIPTSSMQILKNALQSIGEYKGGYNCFFSHYDQASNLDPYTFKPKPYKLTKDNFFVKSGVDQKTREVYYYLPINNQEAKNLINLEILEYIEILKGDYQAADKKENNHKKDLLETIHSIQNKTGSVFAPIAPKQKEATKTKSHVKNGVVTF